MRHVILLILLMKALPGALAVLRYGQAELPARSTMPAKDARPNSSTQPPAGTPAPRLRGRQTTVYGPETCGFYNVPDQSQLWYLSCGEVCNTYSPEKYFGCHKITACQDGAAAGNTDASTSDMTDSTGWGPYCVTFFKHNGDLGRLTLYGCYQSEYKGNTVFTMAPEKANQVPATTTTTSPETSSSSSSSAPSIPPSTMPASTSPSAVNERPSPDSSTGAIVGGAVGGVAVVAIAVCFVVWITFRRRMESRSRERSPSEDQREASHAELPGQPKYAEIQGKDEHYKYQPVPVGSPTGVVHEVPGSEVKVDRSNAVELN
ncbi:hypothetical protein CMUS01_07081 [Colletotrichum musicola]|uniref:Uncharacterized protein n=1 Tax=Colletotrichum musicola TaxID=2175873 RepID=A0A8H6KJ71_9PEZI|nr:hypothetical protein CMUS01_07081 [Colletotrichum musicola]